MYCPNCGRKSAAESNASCRRCGLELGPVAKHLEAHKAALAETERRSTDRTYRLLGQALFVALAAVPVGLAARNTLQERRDLVGPTRS